MTPGEAAWLLEEWARWTRSDGVDVGYPHATAFGRMIVPDPAPGELPVDVDRAARTDAVIAKLPRRYKFLVKLHFLDTGPVEAKARRLRMRRKSYQLLVRGVVQVVAMKMGSGKSGGI